jgi:cytochrome P450
VPREVVLIPREDREQHREEDEEGRKAYPMHQSLQSWQDVLEQYGWCEEMRATQPVWLDDASGCWHVFRYEDVNHVLTDYTHFSSDLSQRVPTRFTPIAPSVVRMDPPQHGKYRQLIAPVFTPRALSQLSGRITAIAQGLLDRARPTGHMDVIGDLAYPLPVTVIAEMLGVPSEDRPVFKRWADALFTSQLSDQELLQSAESERFRQVQPIMQEMVDYFTRMLEERRRQPRADLMSELLAAEVDGAHLRLEEVISFCFVLLLAGHVTTTNLLGNAILCLDAHPEAMERLRQQPDLMPGAIEEVLRYASPVWRISRVATTEVTVGDVRIPADALIFAWLASANRDSAQFPDPDRFDITRSPNRHVAFGHGIHFCVGAPLARLEASIALPLMLEQLPQLHRVPDAPLELLDSRFLFGVKRLPVAFAATASIESAQGGAGEQIPAHPRA